MLQVKVKANAVRNLTDARYFASKEVEWIGFPLQPGTEGSISPSTAKTFIEWIDGVKIVGEFEFPTAEEVLDVHRQVWFDAIQVGLFTGIEEMKKLWGLTLIREIAVEKNMSEPELLEYLSAFAEHCDYFLLNFEKGGLSWESVLKGEPFSVDFLKKITVQYPVILSLNFQAANILQAISTLQPAGIGLSGGAEERTGVKSFDELADIFDTLELQE